jgi:hypothetical protein
VKIDEKFNKRTANLIEVQPPSVRVGPQYALGIVAEFYTLPGDPDQRTLKIHLTPAEALHLSEQLLAAARRALQP